ncbi:MAG: hypothetical protein LUD15_01320, partial [Bacteroides sp.]|nr:hypothetical protein [Bacteroides sp.]
NDNHRVTPPPRQHIQLRNIPEAWLTNRWQLVKELEIPGEQPLLVNDVISCTGVDTCRLGICLAKGAAKAVRNRLLKSDLQLDKAGALKINISGCSNSCAQHI